MKDSQIIVLATPVFLALIALEFWVGWRRGRNTYRLHDAMASIGLGMVSQLTGLLARLLGLGVYTLVYQKFALTRLPTDALWVWAAALLLYDLAYYWNHRLGHRVAGLWAAHVVHHQSEDYNLSTALRQSGTGFLASWVFYLPLAVLGFAPLVIGVVALVDLLYQYWVHTQQIGKLGWFDRWFCSPSNHRVHHAVNDAYVDKNYGGILIIWDRIFGSFVEERDDLPCVYGTRSPLRSWNPVKANLQVYAELLQDSWHTRGWADKLRLWLKPPGWRPDDLVRRFAKPAFDITDVDYFDPPASPAAQWASVALFGLLMVMVLGLLWFAPRLGVGQIAAGLAAVLAVLSAIAWLGSARRTAPQPALRPPVKA